MKHPRLLPVLLAVASLAAARAAQPVTLTEVDQVIPTYLSGPPDPNPMFYFGRDSQGAQGRIYPYPLYDNLTNRKADKTYHLVYLENEYVKIGILPEIGGRLLSALDKTDGYDFIYHQHVIKPALIGLIGAWMSGGIEWNIPHHHRASTFLPVQYWTESGADGSKTIWVGELEIRQRMRWAVGYTLRPGSSVLECSVRILNRTPLANTMLCFANVAVAANDNYQIIFPPSTQHVAYHFKRDFADWPIARTRFNGTDFTAGVDVSWYKNHQSANSMFAWNYRDDFFAGYDHGREAGIVSVADHHIVPGKKFWTWGNGPYGRVWDHILTDDDGPYVELMVGAYSDNQPDYSWLQPFESKSFAMHWYPIRELGGVKNANLDAAVNLEVANGSAAFAFDATSAHPSATVRVTAGETTLLEEPVSIDPAHPFSGRVDVPAGTDPHDVRAALLADGRELVAYSPVRLEPEAMPDKVTPPGPPEEFATDEELDLAGQRIDQFHDPAHQPEPYWDEALRRDPGDVGAHMGLGLVDLRNARYPEAEAHFRKALARLTAKYTMPADAAPYYYLGEALRGEGRVDEAYDAFYKATWDQKWLAPAYYELAEIASIRGDAPAALGFLGRSIDGNALNLRAYGLEAAMLRHLGRAAEARDAIATAARKLDPLDPRLMAEAWLLSRDSQSAARLRSTLEQFGTDAQELAAEYADAGLTQDGYDVLQELVSDPAAAGTSPLVYYYLGDFAEALGRSAEAAAYRRRAAEIAPDYVFPFQAEEIGVLRRAIAADPADARAPYYLGNLLFDWQPDQAVALWKRAAELDPGYPVVWRNLAQAASHRPGEGARAEAIADLEKAVSLSDAYPTHFAELDELYAADGRPADERLKLLEAHEASVVRNDEALASLVRLETFAGRADRSIALLKGHIFNIWEGATPFDTGAAWTEAHLVRGLAAYDARRYADALGDFRAALAFPDNLRVQRGSAASRPEVSYWTGMAEEALGDDAGARAAWADAAAAADAPAERPGPMGEAPAVRGLRRYYAALALQKLGRADQAAAILRDLVAAGTADLRQPPAEAGPQTSPRARAAAACTVAGLGYAGLGDRDRARAEFIAALTSSPDDLQAKLALGRL
jgi:tetratricopeptide (TPR) repeat protein